MDILLIEHSLNVGSIQLIPGASIRPPKLRCHSAAKDIQLSVDYVPLTPASHKLHVFQSLLSLLYPADGDNAHCILLKLSVARHRPSTALRRDSDLDCIPNPTDFSSIDFTSILPSCLIIPRRVSFCFYTLLLYTHHPDFLTAVTSPTDTTKTNPTTSILSTETSTTPTTQSVETTSTATAPTSSPPSTQLITSIITASSGGSSQSLQTVVITQGTSLSQAVGPSNTGTSTSTSSPNSAINVGQNKGSKNGGLSAGGKTAIAVVIPVVVVALLVIASLFLWRKRNQRKSEKEERKKEMEEYGYNPNHDPTLPAVAATDEIAEDQTGYRGWGTTSNSNRKASTTISGGMTHLSDGVGYQSPGSPTQGASVSDQNSGEPLMNQPHEIMDSEIVGNLVTTPAAVASNNAGVRRGPSNASSAYSAGDHSANSGEARVVGPNGQQDYYTDNAYYQPGPYENPYGNGQQPVIRDNPARRNTRIERPDVFPHQGTSGIAQNF